MSTKAPTATDQTATTPRERAPKPVAAGTRIGHVHLKTADIQRVHDFYVGILGFDVIFRMPEALFLSAGGYHHHLGFQGRLSPPAGNHRSLPRRDPVSDPSRSGRRPAAPGGGRLAP